MTWAGPPTRQRFEGQIAGVGTTSGVRLVVGRWSRTPLGGFCDVMVERADGHRILLCPNGSVRDLVASTYVFDEVRMETVDVCAGDAGWSVRSRSLELSLTLGRRMPLGWLLHAVPFRLASSPAWATAVDPVARLVVPGVRTRGVARPGHREWYGGTDLRLVGSAGGRLDGHDLGRLAPVDPPCRFGFSSTPRTPSVTSVVTTIESRSVPTA